MLRSNYVRKLKEAIRAVHGCESSFVSTSHVKAVIDGKTAWEGEVETFDLEVHPMARRCHAWGYEENGQFRSTAVLEIHPVDSPATAVDVAISAKAR